MPKVHCSLPNASDNINGVKFEPAEGGVVSEEVDQETAEAFAAIDGYSIVGAAAATKPAAQAKTETAPKGGKKAQAAAQAPAAETSPAGDEKPAGDEASAAGAATDDSVF